MTLVTHLLSGAWFKNKLIKINILPKINYITYERWHRIVIHHPPFTDNYIYNSYIGLTLLYWWIKRMLFTSQCPEEWNLDIQKKRIRNTMSFLPVILKFPTSCSRNQYKVFNLDTWQSCYELSFLKLYRKVYTHK